MSENVQSIALEIIIQNKEPVELIDFTRSFLALSNTFSDFVEKNADNQVQREAKLYVKEIKPGSIVVDLVEYSGVALLPFIDNFNNILEFSAYLKGILTYFLNGTGDKPEVSPKTLNDMSTFIAPVAKDNGSQMTIQTLNINTGDLNLYFSGNSTESITIQENLKREYDEVRELKPEPEIHSKVLMSVWQARSDIKSKTGNKVIIDELSEKPLNVIFENETDKEKILMGDDNPLNTAYVVDVIIQTAQNNPAAYKVLKFHEAIDLTRA